MTTRPLPARGFTLVELLTVIAIIAVLAALIFPVITSMQRNGRSVKCTGQLRQFGVGVQNYANDNDGQLVYAATMQYYWMQLLLPYMTGTKASAANPNELPNIAWCPEWFITDPVGKKQTKAATWDCGYSMNVKPGTGNSDSSIDKANRQYTDDPSGSWTRAFRLSEVTYPATRLLITDGEEWQTDQNGSWISYNRHGKDKANVLFFDYHVEPCTKAEILLAVKDPKQLQKN